MVRFNDKPLITTLSDDDIMPITDMSEPSSDKKMNMKQLSEYVANLASHDVASAFKTLGTETVSSDSSAYKEILDRKHSTFDRSKFTVVGTPVITDDGIASGFSGSNYLTIPFDYYSNNLKIVTRFYWDGIVDINNKALWRLPYNEWSNVLVGASNSRIAFYLAVGSGDSSVKNFLYTLPSAGNYTVSIEFTGTQYLFNVYKDNLLVYTDTYVSNQNFYYGAQTSSFIALGGNNTYGFWNSSIDLKQFSITVDGVEVFNGNKTAVDVIKEDNYEVIGTPTITEDGIASGFSSANYLGTNNFSFGSSSWEIISSFIFTGTATGNRTVYAGKSANASAPMLYVQNNQFSCYIPETIGNWGYTKTGISQTFTMNTKYWIKFGYNNVNSHYYAKVSTDGINYTTKFDEHSSYILLQGTGSFDFSIGYNKGYNTNPFDVGSIDLNSFKIYVDGNLVYQPCLKIPYIQSKTGSKIVNATYRDRVFDLYEQTGKALYYTIDEENKNFTAPLSDIYGMITDNASLKNFTPEGKERFEAQNAYLTGDVLKEEQGLNQVKMMKHSTFDKSKFTVVGSPTITDDGIVSGFSSSSRIETNFPTSRLNAANTFKIRIPFTTSSTMAQGNLFTCNSVTDGTIGFSVAFIIASAGGDIYCYLGSNGTSWDIQNAITGIKVQTNKSYIGEIEFTGNSYIIKVIDLEDNSVVGQKIVNSSLKVASLPNTFKLGASVVWSPFNGSIDLKQFSITVDGKEVFNGNKTGIDQIKADNFTKVGSPVISNDGVVSGFSSSNYLTAYTLNTTKSWKIEIEYTIGNASVAEYILACTDSSTNMRISRSTSGYGWACGNAGGWIFDKYTDFPFINGDKHKLIAEFTGTAYTLDVSVNGGTPQNIINISSTDTVQSCTFKLGVRQNGQNPLTGSIDLNSFKIYIDGDLVYQPTLRIPYTQSKTGCKIVNAVYRDRVKDMYEQFGYAPYYTLEDASFTLPKGEVYGLIGSRSLKSHFRSGINYYDVYSDRELEQGGACTANVAVNLLKSYEDANYVLSVPYSAKTATSFTPTTSGTWMAKGIAKSLD